MKLKGSLTLCIVTLLLVSGSSCNHYIDAGSVNRSIKVADGELRIYNDSNILDYASNIGLKSDMQVVMPRKFSTSLPKGIRWYSIFNSESFSFYYKNNQVVAISINLNDSTATSDTSYLPEKGDVENFISSFPVSENKKFDIKNIDLKPGRKNLIIRKNMATILLYNIGDKEYDEFAHFLAKFKFI